jgi:hypothetical protein
MIYVFKTSVKTKRQIKELMPEIDKILSKVKWNFDLEDCDNILRIDSEENIVTVIIDLLKKHHIECAELE